MNNGWIGFVGPAKSLEKPKTESKHTKIFQDDIKKEIEKDFDRPFSDYEKWVNEGNQPY